MNTLQSLKELEGAFMPDGLVPKQIKFRLASGGDEYTAEIFVRRLSIGTYDEINVGMEAGQTSKLAKLISSAIRLGEGGKEEISYTDAYQLNRRLANAMLLAITQVNGGAVGKN